MIARYMAQFIARAVADKLLPLAFIADDFATSSTRRRSPPRRWRSRSSRRCPRTSETPTRPRCTATAVDLSIAAARRRGGRPRRRRRALLEKAGLGFYEAELVEATRARRRRRKPGALLASLETHGRRAQEGAARRHRGARRVAASQTIDAAAAPPAARAIMKCVLETAREDPFKMTPILNAIMNAPSCSQAAAWTFRREVNVPQANRAEVQGSATPTAGRRADQTSSSAPRNAVSGRLPAGEDLGCDARQGEGQLIEFFTWLETADEEHEAGEG